MVVEKAAWEAMVAHARGTYPAECCGAMLGRRSAGEKRVTLAVRLENAFRGPRRSRYEVRPEDLLEATREARRAGLELLGIYHSHPDGEARFSPTDLKNSCPWYSFLVLSIRGGEFDHARCYQPDQAQSAAEEEDLSYAC